MFRNPLLKLSLLAVIAMGMGSCAEEISQLGGAWRLFYINHLDDPNIYIWDFADNGELIITSYPLPTDSNPNPTPGILGTGKYETTTEFLDAVVIISEVVTTSSHLHTQMSSCCMGDNSASWTILNIDSETLRIGTADAGGYVMREFTRER
ncbi:MAG: hypothetical protein K9J06_09235 [Flavobacteriales bacterium]|nr:hypothetical protein [Flavobacteriales bacterium]